MIIFLAVLLVGTVWLQPHVKALVFGQQTRPESLDHFIQQVQSEQGIDEKTFWEFRERYAPGSFTFAGSVAFLGTQVIQELPAGNEPLHTFTSPHMVSKDYVLLKDSNRELVDQAKAFLVGQTSLPASEEDILFSNESNLLYKNLDGKTVIFFFRPLEELYAVDGLFDFTDPERELLKDTYWLNLTILE